MSDLNDRLDDIFGGDLGPVRSEPIKPVPAYKPAEQRFEEGCPKCRGTGKFVSYSGRVLGECFACKGAGKKVFKTSAATRATNREQSAERKQRIEQEGFQAWVDANPAEHDWLVKTAPRWDLAASLLGAAAKYGNLTEKQMAVVHNGMARDAQRAERAAAPLRYIELDVSRIEQAFATAREKAARPGQMGVMVKPLNLQSGEVAVRVSPGSIGSQWEGQIFFKSIDGQRKLGYVKGGKFIRQFACTDVEADAVVNVAANPKEGLIAYGKAWSRCGVCGRGLLNDESIERGIGPICFERYGLM